MSKHAKLLQQTSGSQMASMLYGEDQKKKKPHINYSAANRNLIKQTQEQIRYQRQLELEQQQQKPFKMQRFKDISSKITQEMNDKSPREKRAFLRKNGGNNLATRGIIRYEEEKYVDESPQNKTPRYNESFEENDDYLRSEDETVEGLFQSGERNDRSRSYSRKQHEQEEYEIEQYDKDNNASTMISENSHTPNQQTRPYTGLSTSSKNYISANARAVVQASEQARLQKMANAAQAVKETKHADFAKIPFYLQERKAELEAKKKAELEAKTKVKLPEGMRQLSEEERLNTLQLLNDQLQEANKQLMAMPLRIETISRKKAKDELEAKIKQLEDAIRQFSKKVVYVTDD